VGKKSVSEKVKMLVGSKGPLGKLLSGYEKLQEAKFISRHFSDYLEPVVALNSETKENSYKIRHNVYCEELNFEPVRDNQLETDEFDKFSLPCLVRHKRSFDCAGTVRIVRPLREGQLLPIEKYCLDSITHKTLSPSLFPREQVCEISRLAVPKAFRKRQMDKYSGSAVGVINEHTYSENELRCFPFIALGLYFSAAAMVMHHDIKHTYVMMEPRLARSIKFVGINFEQLGPVVDYHGRRAPYYINPSLFYSSLRPSFRLMFQNIQEQINRFPKT